MFSIKTKQVAGVTLIVGLAVVLLTVWYSSSLLSVWLGGAQARAKLLADAITQRAFAIVATGADPAESLRTDDGLKSILQATAFSPDVLWAEIVDQQGVVIADSLLENVGKPAPSFDDLATLLSASPLQQIKAIYTPGGRSYEFRQPLFIGQTAFGSVRVGISTVLLKEEFQKQLRTPLITAAIAIGLAVLVAMVLAQIALQPIHVIRSGLARLGRGELDVNVDLPSDTELEDLGASFKAVSARLAADRSVLAGQRAALETVADSFEDAVALVSASGAILFTNQTMLASLGGRADATIDALLPEGHPYRDAVRRVVQRGASLDAVTVTVPGEGERLLLAHIVQDSSRAVIGVLLVARNLAYLTQVESTLSYSRKLAALGRLSAGIAHEVKNPLNATMIHLELLRMKLADAPAALEHVAVIAAQMRRLDEVVQGFLKFTRPEEVELRPVALGPLIDDLMPIVSAEAGKSGVDVRIEFPANLPEVNADAGMLQQAFLNLALNACQAMPTGGRLRIAGSVARQPYVQVEFEDTGVGIAPEHLARIFDLYFTTKEHGSGIGLSLVYRTVQLHDGEIEVQSVPGRGTTFRLLLRRAVSPARVSVPAGLLGLRDVDVPESPRSLPAS